jgi:hypothetical protein
MVNSTTHGGESWAQRRRGSLRGPMNHAPDAARPPMISASGTMNRTAPTGTPVDFDTGWIAPTDCTVVGDAIGTVVGDEIGTEARGVGSAAGGALAWRAACVTGTGATAVVGLDAVAGAVVGGTVVGAAVVVVVGASGEGSATSAAAACVWSNRDCGRLT